VTTAETATVDATVRNFGSVAGTKTVTLTAGGESVATTRVDVPGNSAATVTLRFSPDTEREYDLAVGDADAGALSVEAAEAETPAGEDDESGGSMALIGGVVVALILGAALVYAWRRQADDEPGKIT
jgi:cobalamin biosynthesis Mg chelatase CobN